MNRILGGCTGQGDNRHQRASGGIVRIRRNNDCGPLGALLMPLDRIQPAPIDLAPFDRHFSSPKSASEARSQLAISARARANASGSLASRAKAS